MVVTPIVTSWLDRVLDLYLSKKDRDFAKSGYIASSRQSRSIVAMNLLPESSIVRFVFACMVGDAISGGYSSFREVKFGNLPNYDPEDITPDERVVMSFFDFIIYDKFPMSEEEERTFAHMCLLVSFVERVTI